MNWIEEVRRRSWHNLSAIFKLVLYPQLRNILQPSVIHGRREKEV